jgi:hypothetical protein
LATLDEMCHPEIIATNTGGKQNHIHLIMISHSNYASTFNQFITVQHAIHKIDSDGDVIEKQIKRRNVDLERAV